MKKLRPNQKWMAAGLMILGILIGVVWTKLYIFPFPQLDAWKQNRERTCESEITVPGRWRKISDPAQQEDHLTDEQKKMIDQLKSIGYLTGSQPASLQSGITVYEKDRSWNGLNLVTSGHAPEAILMDMEGNEIHKWSCSIDRALPDFEYQESSPRFECWRRSHLMENGDLLAIFERVGLVKLDMHSNVIWRTYHGVHHDLCIAENGNIYTLTCKSHINPKYNADKPILEDFITMLSPDGQMIREISVLETLENTEFAPILNRLDEWGDITHTNTIELLERDGPLPYFRKGRIILSMLSLDLVSVVDLKEGTVWAETDLWSKQHQPTLLKNGHLLILDNKGFIDRSRIIEIDPLTHRIHWVYGGVEKEPFFTPSCGSCQRLPNGNTLITESDFGRAFEVTRNKRIVWEFLNPYRAGSEQELIATLFEVVRLDPDFSLGWIQ